MSLLELQCRHQYPGGFVLDVAFELCHPVTALFGPSGSGKTSVLSVVAGLLRPQLGRVRLGDRTVLDTAGRVDLPPERRGLGVVFHDHLLFPHLTVEANLRYGWRRHGRRQPAIELDRVVEVLQIGGLLKRYPGKLSGGEQQRVALGRALLCGPELLLMDEPLAALDARLKARILGYLQRVVAQWEIPTLFVSHSQADVRRAADWVVVLDQGRVVASGTPEAALSQPEPLGWRDAAGPMNLLRLEKVRSCGDHAVGHVGRHVLYLPPLEVPATSPMFVELAPSDVTLSRHDVAGLSARNHLPGRVCHVVPLRRAVFVAVDVGQVLWARVTAEAAAELGLQPGSQVVCLVKAHSLRVVE